MKEKKNNGSLTIFSDIWVAKLFPPKTAAVVHKAWPLTSRKKSLPQLDKARKFLNQHKSEAMQEESDDLSEHEAGRGKKHITQDFSETSGNICRISVN